MNKQTIQKFQIDGILSLLLFGVLAACLLLVLLGGTKVYSRIVERDDIVYTQRTAAQYFSQKLRSAPTADGVSLMTVDGEEALAIWQELDGEDYLTVIYCYHGWLWEIFTDASDAAEGFDPECGEKLLELTDLKLEKDQNLVTVSYTTAGRHSMLTVSLRGEQEVAS